MTRELVEHSSLVEQSADTPAVLVVDDELHVRMLLRSALVSWGYTVDLAAEGLDALERLTQRTYDVILTDINMPRMDGVTLWRNAVAAGHPGTWILMTGLAPPPVGCFVPVLYKPFQLGDLRQMLAHMLPVVAH